MPARPSTPYDPANPLYKLSEEQLEAIGKEFDALHDEVFNDLGDVDARYIRNMITVAAPARRRVAGGAAVLPVQAGLGARHRRALGGQDPREHGDRAQRHARAVGLDERPEHPLLDLGLGHRVAGRRVEALAQLRPPHVHERDRQGQGRRLRGLPGRPAAAVEPGVPAPADRQHRADGSRSSGVSRCTTSTSRRSAAARSPRSRSGTSSRRSAARSACRSSRTTSPTRRCPGARASSRPWRPTRSPTSSATCGRT